MKVRATITTKIYKTDLNTVGEDKANIRRLLAALDNDPKYGDLEIDIREVRSPNARIRDH